jgi:hypothetical protein
MITFEWDPPKAATNLKKHQISFEEARSVFFDEFAVQFFDEAHSLDEERFLLLGMSSGAKLLIVCHCERNEGEVIRIISARKATKRESEFYQGVLLWMRAARSLSGDWTANRTAPCLPSQLINTHLSPLRIWQTRPAMLWSVRQKIARPFTY